MSLLITNGRIITSSDDYVADVYCEDGTIAAIGTDLPAHRVQADRTIDATGKYVIPGGIDVHTHINMPFGGATSADDFESGTIAAAFGGTTSIVDFAIQYRGQTMRHALDDWRKRADGKAVIDYGFHLIITELEDAGLGEMDRMVRDEGITSFKLFMAYPGVFMVDDATIFRALRRTGENGGLVCMHAENGGVIDELVKEALRKGETAPKYHALTRPPTAEGEATGRAIALAEMAGVPVYIVHLSAAHALGEGQAGARRGPARLRRDLPAVPVPLLRQLRGAGLRRREVRDVAAARATNGTRTPCGRGSRRTTSRSSRRTTARSAWRRRSSARTTSARSRTAPPASKRASRSSTTAACRPGGSA